MIISYVQINQIDILKNDRLLKHFYNKILLFLENVETKENNIYSTSFDYNDETLYIKYDNQNKQYMEYVIFEKNVKTNHLRVFLSNAIYISL
jgi:hypothetical protein